MPPLGMCLALAANGVLGRGGALPWDFPEDRAHFFRVIEGRAIVMGRRTFEETGAAIAGSHNVVVSRSIASAPIGTELARSVDEGIAVARRFDAEPIVIGGAEIFRAALPSVTRIWLTEIDRAFEGDTTLALDRGAFQEISRREVASNGTRLSFVELIRA